MGISPEQQREQQEITSNMEDSGANNSRKVRKPYTITKSRESWTDVEHDKFIEALQLFGRDWKNIEAFIGSKTVIQIRSHAQKYFLKVEKSGTSDQHLPPPRPKRKAAHPYPHKAPKSAATQVLPQKEASLSTGASNTLQSSSLTTHVGDDARVLMANNTCSSTDSRSEATVYDNYVPSLHVMPDFAQVYTFLGSVFDPSTSGHMQKLKEMDPINVETVLLLMRNLSRNLTSPEFEPHRRLLSEYSGSEQFRSGPNQVKLLSKVKFWSCKKLFVDSNQSEFCAASCFFTELVCLNRPVAVHYFVVKDEHRKAIQEMKMTSESPNKELHPEFSMHMFHSR